MPCCREDCDAALSTSGGGSFPDEFRYQAIVVGQFGANAGYGLTRKRVRVVMRGLLLLSILRA